MPYVLASQTIRRPTSIKESNSTQFAAHRTLNGGISRDYFGANKRVWELEYENVKKSEYDTIKAIYDSYLNTNSTKTWEITESNYTVSETSVHIDLEDRDFGVKGESYISSFTLTLTEA